LPGVEKAILFVFVTMRLILGDAQTIAQLRKFASAAGRYVSHPITQPSDPAAWQFQLEGSAFFGS
jgi:hypothetical protein